MSNIVNLAAVRRERDSAPKLDLIPQLEAALANAEAIAREAFPDLEKLHWSIDLTDTLAVRFAVKVPRREIEWDGPGIYDFTVPAPPRHKADRTNPHAFLDRAPERDSTLTGRWFVYQHYYRGKFEGRPCYVREADLRIFEKREVFAPGERSGPGIASTAPGPVHIKPGGRT